MGVKEHWWRFWASTSTACIPTPSVVRHGTFQHNYAVERGLVVGFCGQPFYCNLLYYLTTRFWSPSSHMVSAQPFLDRPGPMLCKSAQMGSCLITFLWLWPATDHEPHSRHVPTNKIRRRTETTPLSGWWQTEQLHSFSCETAAANFNFNTFGFFLHFMLHLVSLFG